jgi:hypothetical protein
MADIKHPSSEHHHNAAAHHEAAAHHLGKLLIIMRAAGTIEERNVHPRPMKTAVKRMGTPPPHIRIPANKNSWRPNSLLGSPLPSAAGFLFRRLASKMVPRSRIGVMRANGA